MKRIAYAAASICAMLICPVDWPVALPSAARDASAAEIARLDKDNWDQYAPVGKEVDAIYGDFALRNDQLVAIIAEATPTRHANLTIHDIGGCLIDLARRDRPNDQLGALYPAGSRSLELIEVRADNAAVGDRDDGSAQGQVIELEYQATPLGDDKRPLDVRVVYTLADGDQGLSIRTEYVNSGDAPVEVELREPVRCDGEFEMGIDDRDALFWARDVFWRQAYLVAAEAPRLWQEAGSLERNRPILRFDDPKQPRTLAPGEKLEIVQRVYPAEHDIAARAALLRSRGAAVRRTQLDVADRDGPVADALVSVDIDGRLYGKGLTDHRGKLLLELPTGECRLRVSHDARGETAATLGKEAPAELSVELPRAGLVLGVVTDGQGRPIACKVDFQGVDGTATPDFGPDSAIEGVRNLVYTPDGRFQSAVRPGTYRLLVSHGPEYDAVALDDVRVEVGQRVELNASLPRTVDTSG